MQQPFGAPGLFENESTKNENDLVGWIASTLATLDSSSPLRSPSKVNLSPPVLQTSICRGRSIDPVTNKLSLDTCFRKDRIELQQFRNTLLGAKRLWKVSAIFLCSYHASPKHRHKLWKRGNASYFTFFHPGGEIRRPEQPVEDLALTSLCCKVSTCRRWPSWPPFLFYFF